MPAGVSKVMMRSDSAGYQKELLRYCAEGRDERFGVIEFCVGVDVMPEFKAAVKEVGEDGWHDLYGTETEHRERTGQQYAEVCYVTDWTGYSKNSPDYRFIAIREPLRNPQLFDVEDLPVPTMQMGDGRWYKVTGVVTNRQGGGGAFGAERGPCGGQASIGEVRVERRVVGHSDVGVQSELGDEAAGAGRRVGEQASEGGALRGHLHCRTSGQTREEADHPPHEGTSCP